MFEFKDDLNTVILLPRVLATWVKGKNILVQLEFLEEPFEITLLNDLTAKTEYLRFKQDLKIHHIPQTMWYSSQETVEQV